MSDLVFVRFLWMNSSMVTDSPNLDWLRDFENTEDRLASAAEFDRQQSLAADLLLKSKAPDFVESLFRELALLAGAIDQKRRIVLFSTSGGPRFEQQARVSMRRVGAIPKLTYTDVFHTLGTNLIRCNTVEGEAFRFTLHVGEDVFALPDRSIESMDHRAVAQFIMQRMMRLTA